MNTNQSEAQLLLEEDEWIVREGEIDNAIWYQQGVKIYEQLVSCDPTNSIYIGQYCKVLLDSARDLKIRLNKYVQAKELLEKILLHDPNHTYANYHLGFMAYYVTRNYGEAIERLSIFLKSNSPDKSYRFHALCYIAICYHFSREEDLAQEKLQEARSMNPDRMEKSLLESANMQIQLSRLRYKQIQMITKNGRELLDVNEYHDKLTELENETGSHFVLSRVDEPFIMRQERSNEMGPQQAELLEYLMITGDPVSQDRILEQVFSGSSKYSNVRETIKKIRTKLAPVMEQSPTDIIQTVRGNKRSKYHWAFEGQWWIFKRDEML